jgi:hypothetical protein
MAKKEKKQRTLDIFNQVLPAVDTRQKDFYSNLTEEQQKEFSPWLVQRYVSSVNHTNQEWIEHYLIMTNEIVNINFSVIKDHDMLWKLLCIVGIGKSLGNYGHPFIPPPAGPKKSNAFKAWLHEQYNHLSEQEIDLWFSNITKEQARDMLEQYQVKDKDIVSAANDL